MQSNNYKHTVHHVLAHSYMFYFIAFLFGLFLDSLFPIKLFEQSRMTSIGVLLLILATALILWAQHTSKSLPKENITKETFCRGPYRYTRSPTHWGLFLLLLGFGIISNTFFIIMLTSISFIVTKLVFIKKQENILAEKYGTPYLEYKKSVKF